MNRAELDSARCNQRRPDGAPERTSPRRLSDNLNPNSVLSPTLSNPWDAFGSEHAKGEKIKGTIKSITDFGIFIGLNGNIDGLVHLSDISWSEPGEEAVRAYNKGDEIETVILSIDSDRERISLGIKQLEEDPFSDFVAENDKGKIVNGTVKSMDAKAAIIDLGNDTEQTNGFQIARFNWNNGICGGNQCHLGHKRK